MESGLTAPGFEIEADLSEMCLDCVEKAGVDGVGLAVFAHDGTPGTVHATNELAARIEDRSSPPARDRASTRPAPGPRSSCRTSRRLTRTAGPPWHRS